MAITSLDIQSGIKGISMSISDKLNDEIIPKIESNIQTIDTLNNKINEEIIPTVENNKNNIDEINNLIKDEILPITTDFIELYEVIIIRILLSKFVMFLNHIFKWYSYTIQDVENEFNEISYIIVLSQINNKDIYKHRYKLFRQILKDLKKKYDIKYNDIVDETISYNKNRIRN